MGKIVMPKNSALLDEIEAVLKIYYEEDDWLSNETYKERLKALIGADQYQSSYTKKAQITSYFGFTEWQDIHKAQSFRKITETGKQMYAAIQTNNTEQIQEILMNSLETVTFGRNNFGCPESNSDIEPPALFIRAILDLGYLTYKEFAYLLYTLEDVGGNYTDALGVLRSIRSGDANMPESQEINKYTDCKPIMILVRWGFLAEDPAATGSKQIIIEPSVKEKYYSRLRNLKIYNIDMDTSANEQRDEFADILKHNLYGIHIKELNDALSLTDPHVCIGWSCLGDLSEVASREEVGLRYDEHIQKEPRGRGQDVGQIWRFINDVQIGDYIIFADEGVCHIGRIESDYYFDDTENPNEDPDYANKRKVTWLKKNIARSSLSTAFHRSLMTAMSIWGLNDYKSSVVELLKGTYKKDIIDDLGEVQETEGVRMITFESNIDCDLPRNRILFGAPGTGKSHTLDKETDALIKSMDGEYERVTFHPDYSYANFVGTYKPVPSAEGITYKYVPGPFMRVLKKALENANNPDATPRPFVLVIEEINRANVAAVFGDVFQLLDRNGKNISDYSIQASEDLKNHLAEVLGGNPESYAELRIPSNMFIWATMNSADQGVFPMDTAFKRRWDFTYLGIDNGDENIAGKSVTLGKGDYKRVVEWNKLRKAINAVLSSKDFKINEDKLMGPYFLSTKVIPLEGEIDTQKFIDAFKSKVIMYLFEDAAKQKKHTLFSGCSDTTRYSSIRDEFDTKGVFIFCEEIHNQFPAPANGEGEIE